MDHDTYVEQYLTNKPLDPFVIEEVNKIRQEMRRLGDRGIPGLAPRVRLECSDGFALKYAECVLNMNKQKYLPDPTLQECRNLIADGQCRLRGILVEVSPELAGMAWRVVPA